MGIFDKLTAGKDAMLAIAKGDHLTAGRIFLKGGDQAKALDQFFRGKHYLEAAEIYVEKQDFDRASDMFANEGDFVKAGEMAGKAALTATDVRQKQLYGKAASFYEKAEKPLPAADAYEKAGNLQKAVLFYEQAQAGERAAQIYAKLGDRVKAAAMLEIALDKLNRESLVGEAKLDPNQPKRMKLWKALAELYSAQQAGQNQPLKAADFWLKLEQKPKASEQFALAGDRVRAAQLRLDDDNYEAAAQLLAAENTPAAAPLQARIAEHFGLHADAAKLYESTGNPMKAAANHEKSGDRARAAELYRDAREFLKAAKLFSEAGKYGAAAEAYAEEGETAFAAAMYEKDGQDEKAAELYLKIDHAEKVAQLLINKGKRAEALALLQKVPPSAGRFSEVCAMLGELFLEAGEWKLAAERFSRALGKAGPAADTLPLFYGIARAREGLGDLDGARQAYESVIGVEYGYRDTKERLAALGSGASLAPGAASLSTSGIQPALRYRLEKMLSSESLFELWDGYDGQLNRRVKIYRITGAAQARERLLAAATAALELHHPHVESVTDLIVVPAEALVIAETPVGETLAERLSRGPLPLAEALEAARGILRGLAAAHARQLLHGALSPERVTLGPGAQAKVGGFGFIERAEEQLASRPVSSHYLTPEQFTGQKLDARSDLYLFGLLLKHMTLGLPAPLAPGKLPWEHTVSDDADLDLIRLPAALSSFISRCLSRVREGRPVSAEAALGELEKLGLLPGMVVNGRYEVIKEIGVGGMGQVYQVKDRELDESVVLKILRASANDDETRNRFTREIKIARRITHPYVVRVFDIDRVGENLFLTMEMVEGIPLGPFIDRGYCKDMRRPIDLALKIAQGMEAAHQQGVVHRDLKPLNILIDRAGNPKILDFGIAKSGADPQQTELTRAGEIFGSPKYMSPEQCQGLPADGRADIYAYGAILYYMFTGREPFTGETLQSCIQQHLNVTPSEPRTVNPLVPPPINQLIMACLRKPKEQRPGSFTELVAVLGPIRQMAIATAPVG